MFFGFLEFSLRPHILTNPVGVSQCTVVSMLIRKHIKAENRLGDVRFVGFQGLFGVFGFLFAPVYRRIQSGYKEGNRAKSAFRRAHRCSRFMCYGMLHPKVGEFTVVKSATSGTNRLREVGSRVQKLEAG